MLDRQTLFIMVMGLCIFNGIFSPYLGIAIPISAALMPELFPRTMQWVLFWASILLSSSTLLFSGVPVALYEKLVSRNPESEASMWIWLAGAMVLTSPAIVRML